MIRINIKKDGKVKVKSFVEKKDLENYLFKKTLESKKVVSDNPTDKIWNLNVGTSINVLGYNISMAGKSRAGNHLVI
mgnify:FL=1